jgi:cell division protein FtsA
MRPLSSRKSAVLSVLDVGTSKIVCLIARLQPMEPSDTLRGRTHLCRVLGIAHQQSRGIKGGAVVDLDEAEKAIRLAVDAAERMAKVQVEGVIVNMAGGRLGANHYSARINVAGRPVADGDLHRVREAAARGGARAGRAVLHALPNGYTLDAMAGVDEPRGMIGDELGAAMHVVTCDDSAARNLMLAVERCHLDVEAMVAAPYASSLSTLVDDEKELGATVIDLGGGTTTIGVFHGGALTHVDGFAIGGRHVTNDIATGLTIRNGDAERLKALHGSCLSTASDEREILTIAEVGEDSDQSHQIPKSRLTKIIRPRVEEILELTRDRLKAAGVGPASGQRFVLTGGGSQLTGMADTARRILSPQLRVGRPLGVHGLPESAKNPAFAASVGLLIYPQFAGAEHYEPRRNGALKATGTDNYLLRVGRWLRESF